MPFASSARDFFEQRGQVDHHAVADDGLHAGAQDAARDQLEDELFFADVNGVAGIMPSLVARDDVETLGQKIDYFPFTLITPLRTKNDYITHFSKGRPGTIVAVDSRPAAPFHCESPARGACGRS